MFVGSGTARQARRATNQCPAGGGQWLPAPPGYVERLTGLVAQASTLDSLLHDKEEHVVLRQVYKEVTELGAPAGGVASRGAAGSGNAAVLPDEGTLAESLHVIRRALLFMEEVYLAEDLGRRYNHPLYLGLMNYFARWAYAPLFRLWWPLLKGLYAQQFTSFLESQFRLSSIDPDDARVRHGGKLGETVIVELGEDGGGFAKHCWQLQNGRSPRSVADRYQELFVSYRLRTTYRDYGQEEHAYLVQAGQIVARVPAQAPIAFWDSREFFVPPGLWGMGIGEDFLTRLGRGEGPLTSAEHLVVRISVDLGATAAARKEGADDTQLYRGTGFLELQQRDRGALWLHGRELLRPQILDLADDGLGSRWMVRCVRGKCPEHSSADVARSGVDMPAGASPVPGDRVPARGRTQP